jgi:hypothetical protein
MKDNLTVVHLLKVVLAVKVPGLGMVKVKYPLAKVSFRVTVNVTVEDVATVVGDADMLIPVKVVEHYISIFISD